MSGIPSASSCSKGTCPLHERLWSHDWFETRVSGFGDEFKLLSAIFHQEASGTIARTLAIRARLGVFRVDIADVHGTAENLDGF